MSARRLTHGTLPGRVSAGRVARVRADAGRRRSNHVRHNDDRTSDRSRGGGGARRRVRRIHAGMSQRQTTLDVYTPTSGSPEKRFASIPPRSRSPIEPRRARLDVYRPRRSLDAQCSCRTDKDDALFGIAEVARQRTLTALAADAGGPTCSSCVYCRCCCCCEYRSVAAAAAAARRR